jgi:hypothetical protein
MRRILSLLAVAVVAFAAASLVARPSLVKAFAALTGRTHLIVSEQKLKMLRGGPTTTVPTALNEVSRGGSVSPNDYVVPAGRVFVVTDVVVSATNTFGGPVFEIVGAIGDAGSGTHRVRFSRYFPDGVSSSFWIGEHFRFTGGVPFDAGSTVTVMGTNLTTIQEVTVLGYETEDTASLE